MNFDLSTETALVTGATRGIGRAIAVALAQAGAMVYGTATTEAGAQQITEALQNAPRPGQGQMLNVSRAEDIHAFMEQFGKNTPSILVNNAAITRDNLLLRMSNDEWQSVFDTNLTAVFHLSKACLRGMTKARHGRIINITSVVGLTGNPGQANYAAAKAGLIAFSKSLAREIGSRQITVNNVAPGFIDTDMTRQLPEADRNQLLHAIPLNRAGTPDDVAAAVLFLASPAAAYITGETLHVNGGMYMP
jgi:3-oxoacyl-[acyl-carrier protein] reductase